MHSRYILLLLLLVGNIAGYSQQFTYPPIINAAAGIDSFVPAGWLILACDSGDLNGDHLQDMVVVLQHKDSVALTTADNLTDTVITQPRMLLILFRQGVQWALAERNNTFILSHDNADMDDPFQSINIINKTLQVKFQWFYHIGSWYITSNVFSFRYKHKKIYLSRVESNVFHRATHENRQYVFNYVLRRYKVIITNNATKAISREHGKIPKSEIKTLDVMKDAEL